jgi:poly(3-hydroxybutyrate) depolymerase
MKYFKGLSMLAVLAAALLGTSPGRAASLPNLNADISQSSVSGLSSGAYMAGQFHVAFSGTLVGAAIIAGGPYDCAGGSLTTAETTCLYGLPSAPNVSNLVSVAQQAAARGVIDPLSNLAKEPVYLYSGTQDYTVYSRVVQTAVQFYQQVGVPNSLISFVNNIASGHALITTNYGNGCAYTYTPYVNNCGYDQAGALLSWIYGTLKPRVDQPAGQLMSFDQSEFLANPTSHGLAATGYVYIPTACASGATCRVHIAFHGCQQNAGAVGDAFYNHGGYNNWADGNRIVVLYPQTFTESGWPGNNGCWDWWGYDDANYYTKAGRQMAAVYGMLKRLTGH